MQVPATAGKLSTLLTCASLGMTVCLLVAEWLVVCGSYFVEPAWGFQQLSGAAAVGGAY